MSRFTNWMYDSIMPQAVNYELFTESKSSGFLSKIHRFMVQIADAIFSCFKDYSQERESLKNRCLRQITPSSPVSPPSDSSSLIGRVTLPPTPIAIPTEVIPPDGTPLHVTPSDLVAPQSGSPIAAGQDLPVDIETLKEPTKIEIVKTPQASTSDISKKKTTSKRGMLWSTGAKVLKVAFLGGLALGGALGLARFIGNPAAGSNTSLAERPHDDLVHTLTSRLDSLQIPLQEVRWQQQSQEVSSLATHYLTQLHTIRGEAEAASEAELEVLAQQVDDLQKSILSLTSPKSYSGTTPVSQLVQSDSAVKLTESHFSSILEIPSDEPPHIETVIDHLIHSLSHLGENPQLHQKALQLRTQLLNLQEFTSKIVPSLGQHFAKKDTSRKEDSEDDANRDAEIRQGWQTSVQETRRFITERLQRDGGLLLPFGNRFLSITSEGNNERSSLLWTLRIYDRQESPESELLYHPYREKKGLTQEQFLSNKFIAGILKPFLKADIEPNFSLSHSLSNLKDPFLDIMQKETRPPFLPFFDRSLMTKEGLENNKGFSSGLTDLLYVNVGPQATLDYQISSLQRFIKESAQELSTQPIIYSKVRQAVTDLSYACQRAGNLGWIDVATLEEQSRVLQDLNKELDHSQISLRTYLKQQAPSIVDESAGSRKTVMGETIPSFKRSLQEIGKTTLTSSSYQEPLSLLPQESVTPVQTKGVSLDSNKLNQIAKQLGDPARASDALQTFRTWTSELLQNPASLQNTSPKEASQMIASMASISNQLSQIPTPNRLDLADSLGQAIAISDHLMGHLNDPKLKDAHLPIPQIAKQLQNPALFGDLSTSLLQERVQAVQKSEKEPFFAEAIVYNGADKAAHHRRSSRTETWAFARFDKTPLEQLPPHMQYLLKPDEVTQKPPILDYMEKFHLPEDLPEGDFKNLKTMVDNFGRFSAGMLVKRTQETLDTINKHLQTGKQLDAQSVQNWTQHLNPQSIDRLTLEMLTHEESQQLLTALGEIAQKTFTSLFYQINILPEAETMISFLEMMALADKVLAYSTHNLLNSYMLPLEKFNEIIDVTNPFFCTLDPHLDNVRLQGVRDWLQERRRYELSDERGSSHALFNDFKGFLSPESESVPALIVRSNFFFSALRDQADIELPLIALSARPSINPLFTVEAFRNGEANEELGSNNAWQGKEVGAAREKAIADVRQGYFGNGPALPSWFLSLMHLSHATEHMLRSGFINPNPANKGNFVHETVPGSLYERMTSSETLYHRLKGLSPEDAQKFPGIPDGVTKGHLFQHLSLQTDGTGGVLEDIRNLHTQPRQKGDVVYRPGIDRLPPAVYSEQIALTKNYDDTEVAKFSIRQDPNLQIHRTLELYSENPGWFAKSNERIEFFSLLFQPGLLNRFLMTPNVGPGGEKRLAEFLHTQFRAYEGKPEVQVFLTDVATRFAQYSESARRSAPDVYQHVSIPKELEALLQVAKNKLDTQGIDSAERSAYAALNALNYRHQDHLSPKEVVPFLKSVLLYYNQASLPLVSIKHLDRELQQMLRRFGPDIKNFLYTENALNTAHLQEILQGLVKNPEVMTFTSSAENPFVLTNEQDGVELNLVEGRLTQKGQEGVSLPMEARMSLPYKMIFADATYRAKAINSLTYQFTDKQQAVNILQKDSLDGKWHLYRQFEKGEPHKLVTADWIKEDSSKEKWLQSEWMLQQYTHWYRGGSYPEVRLLDQQGNLAYRVSLKGDTIQAIYKKDSATGKEQELADSAQPSYRWASQFDPGYVHIWLNTRTKQGETIEFPRFGKGGMTFSFKNQHWHSNIDPQYYLTDPQVHPFFSGSTSFLRLRTATGTERLLMPRQHPQLSKNGVVSFSRPNEGLTNQVLAAEKNPRTGKYAGIGTEANTFLAMQYFATHDYKHTYDLLASLMSHGERLSEETLKNLDFIIDATQLLSPHDSPQAIAIRVLAAHIKSRNIEAHPKSDKDIYLVPESLQQRYLAVSQGIGSLRLPLAEEIRLFQSLLGLNEFSLEDTLAKMRLANPLAAQQAFDAVLPKLLFGPQRLDVSSLPSPQPLPGEPIAPRKPPITAEELNTLVISEEASREVLPARMASLFDFRGYWYQKLPSAIQNYLGGMEKSAETFQKNRDLAHYRMPNPQIFHEKRLSLEKEMLAFSKDIENLRLQILYLANPIPKNSQQAHLLRLSQMGGTEHLVTLDQLIATFGTQDLTKYQDLIAFHSKQTITEKDAKELDRLVHELVNIMPDWHYYKRLIDTMRRAEEASLHTETTEQKQQLQLALKEFAAATQAGRQFSPEAKRLMHLMEYETGTYYRPLQVENLAKLGLSGLSANATDSSTYSGVWNIGVGVGKTSRIYPSILRDYLERGKPAGIMMSTAQKTTAGAETARIMKEVYGINTVDLEFSRSRSTPKTIQKSLKLLREGMANGDVIRFSDSGMRSLRSIFLTQKREAAALEAQNKLTAEKAQVVEDLREIIKLVRTIPIIAEEVHDVYTPLIETNFPFGEPKPLDKTYGVIILNLVEILGEDADIQKLMHFNFAPHKRQEGAQPFIEQEFNEKIAPLLVKKFVERLSDIGKLQDEELNPLARFVNELSGTHRQELINYLLPKNPAIPTQGAVPAWIQTVSPDIQDQLGLIRGEIRVLLPLTLNKQFGVNYGFSGPDELIPNPFSAAGTPRTESQFFPLALGNYLALANFHEGTRPVIIRTIIKDLRQERAKAITAAIKEGGEIPLGKRIETEADQEFQRLFHVEDLNLDSPDLEAKLEQQIVHQPALLRQLLKDYAYRQVTTYPQNLKTNSQHLSNLSPRWQGFSGTPDNYRTYPGTFQPPAPDDGKMLTLITEQAALGTHTIQARTPEDLLKDPRFLKADAFIDAAGIITGKFEQFADAWGDKVGKARIHIDPVKGIVIKQHSSDRAIPLNTAAIPPDKRVMLYDQVNGVGTDASHKRNAIGCVSVGKDTPFPKLAQACGRMREMESGQSIQLLVLEDDAIVMRQNLALPTNHILTHEDVIRHTLIVNAKKQMADNEIALHHKLRAVLENRIFNVLIDNTLPSGTPGFTQLMDNIFLPDINQSPFNLFGQEESLEDSGQVLSREIEGLIGAQSPNVALLEKIFGDQASSMIQEMRQEMEAILKSHLPYISQQLSSHSLSGIADNTQELQQEQQQELQTELQMELQQEKVQSGEKPAPKPLNDWWSSLLFNVRDKSSIPKVNNFWEAHSGLRDFQANFKSVQDHLKLNPATERLSDLFDSRLLASSNYQQEMPLKGRQKPRPYVTIGLVNNGYRMHLIDTWDAEHFQAAWKFKQGISLPEIGPPMGFFNGYGAQMNKGFKNSYDSRLSRDSGDDPLPASHIHQNPWRSNIMGVIEEGMLTWGPIELTELFDLSNVYPKRSMLHHLPQFPPIADEEFWLGGLSGETVAGNDQLFDLEDPALRRLWAQAQVFGGRFDFTGDSHRKMLIEEITAWLKEWTAAKATSGRSKIVWLEDAEKMLKQLHAHSQETARFASTDLGRIFASLKSS